ncbi:AAA family ATPase [Ralstonia solanacearum]|uniref:AAA family ATPase n=1 Tax=Ralstonia solanacearum TaxID=305 RepID=UPI00078E42BD|nr:AAA family ATPase [Ralstonia solanacearum]AMP36965.1 AAA family ATPase [Ralstonia solanacearum]AXV85775.1 AAA family ATPase [Ralstonia solanacearum]AXW05283.1 AAA family ATPase [Ralstonia solanacearum]AXW23027.1 AAA family ATPase [Ralstonia solanacearum]AXW79974.1 AAA family ATPase [Ralstonia solanacearum]
MVQIEETDLHNLLLQGLRGNSQGFALISRKIISSVRRRQPDEAARLAEVLASDTVTRGGAIQPPPVDGDSRRQLLREVRSVVLSEEPIWPPQIQVPLNHVVRERNEAPKLIAAGLEPVRALLFKGPPGAGKTLAAHWLGRELKLPVLTLDLATVMSSLLGKTGSNIKSVIDYARSFPCILLLDEFDAVAKKRDDDKDVGELKRLVTVLLQAIDEWPSSSVLVAATNHPEILDSAVWRRFDVVLDFGKPDVDSIKQFLRSEGINEVIVSELAPIIAGYSFADMRRLIDAARKQAILDDMSPDEAIVNLALGSLLAAGKLDGEGRKLQIIQLAIQGHSQRKIAEVVGVSHPTVGRILKALKQEMDRNV